MDNSTCYLVCYMNSADTTTYLYNIFYSRSMSEKYYKDRIDELISTRSFDKYEFLVLAEIPINVLDRTGIENYIGKVASKELTKIVTDIYPLYVIRQTCLEKKYFFT